MTSYKREWLGWSSLTIKNLDLSTSFYTANGENIYSHEYDRLQMHNFDLDKCPKVQKQTDFLRNNGHWPENVVK